MIIDTKYFGQLQFDDTDALHFPDGLFGFEEEKQFVLLPFGEENASLLCLQSISNKNLAFLVMNPFLIKPDYAPVLHSAELKALNVEHSQDLCYYVLCVVREPIAQSTVNLQCPVVINDMSRSAIQVILDSGEYGMRHLLSEFQQKGAKESC